MPAACVNAHRSPDFIVARILGGKSSLQELSAERDFPDATLACLHLPKSVLGELDEQVRLLGFRESMIYPDLGGLATEIRVQHDLP